jgi:hypothetical protein
MLAGLSQGYLYLSEHWDSKAQASTTDATNAVFTGLVMGSSLVTVGQRRHKEQSDGDNGDD